jgi:hypothetical protein
MVVVPSAAFDEGDVEDADELGVDQLGQARSRP